MPLAQHLSRRDGGVYYFRMRVPREISGNYNNRKELCFSLKTKDPTEAKKLSYYSFKFSQEFETLVKKICSSSLKQFDCSSGYSKMAECRP